jgi:hypothetical protein
MDMQSAVSTLLSYVEGKKPYKPRKQIDTVYIRKFYRWRWRELGIYV